MSICPPYLVWSPDRPGVEHRRPLAPLLPDHDSVGEDAPVRATVDDLGVDDPRALRVRGRTCDEIGQISLIRQHPLLRGRLRIRDDGQVAQPASRVGQQLALVVTEPDALDRFSANQLVVAGAHPYLTGSHDGTASPIRPCGTDSPTLPPAPFRRGAPRGALPGTTHVALPSRAG